MPKKQTKSGVFNVKIGGDNGFKEAGETGTFEGWVSIYGNIDSDGDVVMSGAFKGSIETDNHRTLLYMHMAKDPKAIIGDSYLEEKEGGLYSRNVLDLDLPDVRAVYQNMKKGRVDCMSYGFQTLSAKWGEQDGRSVYYLAELDITEVSAVLKRHSANPRALIETVKSIPGLTDDDLLDWVKSRFSDPAFTDRLFHAMRDTRGKQTATELSELDLIDLTTTAEEIKAGLSSLKGG